MTSRPILFSAPMVKAILSGTKTQTRRLVTPRPRVVHGFRGGYLITNQIFRNGAPGLRCPYGQPGDELWVKETWRTSRSLDHCKPTGLREGAAIAYESDGRTNINNHERGPLIDPGRIRQSIFMRKWMSRLTLRITDIRVQRLQDISEEDAAAEGMQQSLQLPNGSWMGAGPARSGTYCEGFRYIWESIYSPDSWQENPYVWAVNFDPFHTS